MTKRKNSTQSKVKRNNKSKQIKVKKGGNRTRKHKHTHHKSEFKKTKCAPNPDRPYDFTCYSKDNLERLRLLWNSRHPNDMICVKQTKDIWMKLKQKMSPLCSKESCWLRQNFINKDLSQKLLEESFSPKSPESWKKNPSEWLSNIDIMKVMSQYERSYKCFEFIGPSPIDYDAHYLNGVCVWEELCEFDLQEKIDDKKTKIGIIFNLDKHTEPGSHWVALFIHIPRKEIYYFDSNADEAPKQVKKLIKNITKQGEKLGITFTERVNTTRHQYQDSECGMYSMYFIIQMLKGKTFDYFLRNRISDQTMNKLRKEYFNYDL